MHAEMLLIFLVVLVVVQIILIEWKRRYYRSYMVSTRRVPSVEWRFLPLPLCTRIWFFRRS